MDPAEGSKSIFKTYGTEQALHEALLQSEHRTFDPAAADFFYIPAYLGCYVWPVHHWTRFPWFGPNATAQTRPLRDASNRAASGAWMAVAAKRFVQQQFPFWNRTGADSVCL